MAGAASNATSTAAVAAVAAAGTCAVVDSATAPAVAASTQLANSAKFRRVAAPHADDVEEDDEDEE
jgi:hypothetical protein